MYAQAGQVISAFKPALEWLYDKEITFDDNLKLYQEMFQTNATTNIILRAVPPF